MKKIYLLLLTAVFLVCSCNTSSTPPTGQGAQMPPGMSQTPGPGAERTAPGQPSGAPNAPVFTPTPAQPPKVLAVRNLKPDKSPKAAERFKLISREFESYNQQNYAQAAKDCMAVITDPKQTIPAREAAFSLMSLMPVKYWGELTRELKGKLLYISPLEGTAQVQKLKIKPEKGETVEISTSTFTSRVENEIKLNGEIQVEVYSSDMTLIKKPGK